MPRRWLTREQIRIPTLGAGVEVGVWGAGGVGVGSSLNSKLYFVPLSPLMKEFSGHSPLALGGLAGNLASVSLNTAELKVKYLTE